ncbi:hypothetical protein BGX26_005207 [Mortierella sp. AD094]|nr:hypothetical protein BGX26_005207 [Mortierella sp. AD094]
MIDLSVSWNTTNPVFEKLTCGPTGSSMSSTLSSDGKSWFVLSRNNIGYLYNMESKKWDKILTLKDRGNDNIHRSTAVTNPATGLIYIIDSLPSNRHHHHHHNLRTVNLVTNTVDKLKLSASTRELVSSTTTWSESRNSMLSLFGRKESNSRLAAYSPTTGWSSLNTTGDIPPMRTDGCFVSANGGSSAVYFGGFGHSQSGFHDIHVLNVTTMAWKRGPNVSKANRRGGASCAVSNNQFIAWGGFNPTNPNLPDAILVFNLMTNQWTSSYITSSPSFNNSASLGNVTTVAIEPPPVASPATTSSSSDGSSNSQAALKADPQTNGSSRHIVIITAVVAVAILILLAIGGLVFFCFRKRTIRRNARTMDGDILYHSSLASNAAPIAVYPSKSEMPAEPDHQRHFETVNDGPEPHSNLTFNAMPIAADPPTPKRDDTEWQASSSDDDDDNSTLNESTSYPPKAHENDSYWSIVLSMEQQQQQRRRNSGDSTSTSTTTTSAPTTPLPPTAEIFAFPLPPSPSTTTLDAIQQHIEKHGYGHGHSHGITNAATTMKSIVSSGAYDDDYDKRHSHIGMKCVKSESNNILEICYFPRPISQHATLHDVYDSLAGPAPVPVPIPNVDYGYI